jgi:hypothetical protein
MAVNGNLLWAIDLLDLRCYDLSDPQVPVQIASLNLGTEGSALSRKLSWQGDYLYISGYRAEIRIIDVSDPENPYMIGRAMLPMAQDACSLPPYFSSDGRMIVASSYANQLISYNLDDPGAPEYMEHISLPYRIYSLYSWQDRYYFKRGAMLYAVSFPEPSESDDPVVPPAQSLISCHPNPFSSRLSIRVDMSGTRPGSGKQAELSIYNLRGQKLQSLSLIPTRDGICELSWDGRDRLGNACANGIYLLRLDGVSPAPLIKKATLLR